MVSTSVPRELAAHRVFVGSDVDETREAVARVVSSHTLRLCRRGERLNAAQHAVRLSDVTLTHLGYGASVEIGAPDLAPCFCVQLPLAGSAEVLCGKETLVSSPRVASVPTPSEPLKMRWAADAAHLIVRIEQSGLERYLTQLLGHSPRDPLRLQLGMDMRGPNGVRWRSIVQLILADIAQRDAADMGAADAALAPSSAAIEEIVMSSLVLQHPNNYWEWLRRRTAPATAPYVRRAVEYAREHLDTPLTVGRLAATVGVSARALQAGFARDLGCSPSAYVRGLRLERVRLELLAAEPGDGTLVTDVALHWGFSHLGRFSRFYRERFGEPPSETLRSSSRR